MMHGLSFDIEEHFHVAAFNSTARRRNWESLESRVERNTHLILDLLAEQGVRATMFVLGWVADRRPELVRRIVREGHELGSHGYAHELITGQTPQVFREDIRRAKSILEGISGTAVQGYRAPTFSITKETVWALPILAKEGFRYDSSIVPVLHDFYGIPGAIPTIHGIETEYGHLWEVPPTTVAFGPVTIPVAGGGYFRLFPYRVLKPLLYRASSHGHPLVMYLHPWELDPHQPRMQGSTISKFRHYLNLDKVQGRLKQLLKDFSFGPIHHLLPQKSPEDDKTSLPGLRDKLTFHPLCKGV